MPAIAIKDLKKYYSEVKAVDGISLEVEEREIFGILSSIFSRGLLWFHMQTISYSANPKV